MTPQRIEAYKDWLKWFEFRSRILEIKQEFRNKEKILNELTTQAIILSESSTLTIKEARKRLDEA